MVATRNYFLLFFLSGALPFAAAAQSCGNCSRTPSVAQFDLDVQVPRPELKGAETQGWLEWLQLFWLGRHANAALSAAGKSCIRFMQPLTAEASNASFLSAGGIEIPPLNEESETLIIGQTYTNLPPAGEASRFGNYLLSGYVRPQDGSYIMHMELQAACSRKVVAAATVPFHLSSGSDYIRSIADQAASQLLPLQDKIKQFELEQRQENEMVALDDDLAESIIIHPKKMKLGAGEETDLEITLKDCDGTPLANRKIVFTRGSLGGVPISSGTTGGTVSPSSVLTDAHGKAKARFKMGNEKTAVITAYHVYQKPYGCEGVKLGSATIGSVPVKIEITYLQNETRTLRRATLPGLKIKGGDETEQTTMFHSAVLYHFPSAMALKEGFLVATGDASPYPGSRSRYVTESGYFSFIKQVQTAVILAMAGNTVMVQAVEKGSQQNINGVADLRHPSQLLFFKGNGREPPSFSWNVEYPAIPPEEIGYGGMSFVKGDEGVEWVVKAITDVNSPYKTEYLLSLKLDAAEELKKGNRAMKELFGFNLDEITTAIDPTDPKKDMAGASGTQLIRVRILSPYKD